MPYDQQKATAWFAVGLGEASQNPCLARNKTEYSDVAAVIDMIIGPFRQPRHDHKPYDPDEPREVGRVAGQEAGGGGSDVERHVDFVNVEKKREERCRKIKRKTGTP